MFSHKDMLPEEERRQVEERLKSIDCDLDLPEALSSAQLRKKLSDEDCRNFREAGHPDFMDWQRYAGMVASFIVVLAGLVLFTTDILPVDKFVGMATAAADVAARGDVDEMLEMAEFAAMDMEVYDGVMAEEAEAEATAPVEAPQSTRSRLYASGYESIVTYLNQTAQNAGNPQTGGGVPTKSAAEIPEEDSAEEGSYWGLAAPDATWQKEFTDVPGEGPDVVKSDGTYFYYYTPGSGEGQSGRVHIIEAQSLNEVSAIAVGACDGAELFIRDGRLVVVSQNRRDTASVLYNSAVLADREGQSVAADQLEQQAEQRVELYGVTTVSVYDLSDINQPQLVRSFMQDGAYQSSRLVGGRIYLFTQKQLNGQLATAENALLGDTLPVVRDSLGGGSAALEPQQVAIAPEGRQRTCLTISAFDVAGEEAVATNGVLGAERAYLSDGAVYFVYNAGADQVGIMRMSLGMSDMNISGQTLVSGSLENAFAINRFEDVLRVATVTVEPTTGQSFTKLYMMDDTLHLVGSVEGIGSGEAVTDIRFVDDLVYITSQREERPVFALDLEDPADPVIMGQLELAELPGGFRLVEGSLLVGLRGGEDEPLRLTADDLSGRGTSARWADRLPRTKWEDRLPGASGSSYARADYRALLYNSEQQLLAFPAVCRQTSGSLLQWGYAVYHFDPETGLSRRGILSHAAQPTEATAAQGLDIVRGRVIGSTLYTFSANMVKAHDLGTLKEQNSLKLS